MHLVSWFHADSADFKSRYSQTLGDPTSAAHFAVYERCLRTFFASARRWNPSARLTVVTNVPAEQVFGARTLALLQQLDVRSLVRSNSHRTPPGYYGRWQNQFFVLDVLQAVLETVGDDDGPVMVLDSDCVVTGPIPDDVLGPTGIAALALHRAPDEAENGLSARDLAELVDAVPGAAPQDRLPEYLGGELIAMTPPVLRRVLERAEQVFAQSLQRRAAGETAVNEEAHLVSVAVQSLGLRWRQAGFIERLWTQPWKFRTVRAGQEQLLIWHLPAEKKTGIPRLDRAALDLDSWFWTAPRDVWVRIAGRVAGVPRYGVTKAARDLSTLAHTRLRRAVQIRRKTRP